MESLRCTLVLLLAIVVMVTGRRINGPPSSLGLQADKTYFEFDDIYDSKYRPKSFNGRWFGDVVVYTDSAGNLKSRDMANNQMEAVLIPADHMASVSRYFVSPDLTEVLLATEWKQVWRHSFTAVYHVYNVKNQNKTALLGDTRLQYCNWAPAGGKLAYVLGNNFYVSSSSSDTARQVTTDGDMKTLFNGIPDWLYEEDVLSTSTAHYWSPDARYVIMGRFDDTKVPLQKWKMYGEVSDVYGSITEIAYPKAGYVKAGDVPGDNTVATLHVMDTENPSSSLIMVTPPAALKDVDHYYTRVGWTNSSHVVITWTNRVQNESVLQACHIDGSKVDCYDHYTLEISGGWIDSPWPKPLVVGGGDSYVTIIPKDEGASGHWKHLAHMELSDGVLSQPEFLTSGEEEVLGIAGYDSEHNHVYYLSTGGSPLKRHLYKYDLDNKTSSCVSCDIAPGCQYVSASMPSSADWFILSCLGPDLPSYTVRSTHNNTVITMEDNSAMRQNLEGKHLATREFMTVKVGGYDTQAEIFKPPNFDAKKKYPLLVFVYAGPGSQKVYERYYLGGNQNNWMMHLKSKYGVVVASVDGRGAMARGEKYKFEMYRRLGTVEVQDQITVAKYLKDNLGYIDTTKDAAVFGWSYGGQTSSHILAEAEGVYNCAIAVAPVASKMYYDTAYTERYMGLATKSDNEAGYNGTEVWPKAAKFQGKKYLIAHGTSDDNVHFMHAAHMINELVKEEVQFHQLIYVDENHNIGTRTHSRHLFRAMTDFLVNDCWELNKDPEPVPTPKPTPTSGAATHQLSAILTVAGLLTMILSLHKH